MGFWRNEELQSRKLHPPLRHEPSLEVGILRFRVAGFIGFIGFVGFIGFIGFRGLRV